MRNYAEALAHVVREVGAPLAPGSEGERAAIDRFRKFFSSLEPDRVERLLEATYAETVWFNDTLKTIEGRDALGAYLLETAAAVDACRVEIEDELANGRGDYYLRWRMMIRFKRFARGRDTWSIGMTHLRFDPDGRVLLQQDFWNAAAGLYQYVPVLGAAIRAIQRRL